MSQECTSDNGIANDEMQNKNCTLIPELIQFKQNAGKRLVMTHLNVNGLRSKFPEIGEILRNGCTDFFSLAETKLDNSFPISQFDVPNYKTYREDRNGNGGGLACYVSSSIPHRIRTDLIPVLNGIEAIVIELQLKSAKVCVVTLYRPPSVHVGYLIDVIDSISQKCVSESCEIIFMGDLNVDFMITNHPLTDIMDLYDYVNVVKKPTCFKSVSKPTLLDVILSNKPRILGPTININTAISDFHNLIGVSMKCYIAERRIRKIFYR